MRVERWALVVIAVTGVVLWGLVALRVAALREELAEVRGEVAALRMTLEEQAAEVDELREYWMIDSRNTGIRIGILEGKKE